MSMSRWTAPVGPTFARWPATSATTLAVGGHLTALRRTRVGSYGLDEARTLDDLAEQPRLSYSLDDACLLAFPRRDLSDGEAEDTRHGRALKPAGIEGVYAATAPDGQVIALLRDEAPRTKSVVVLRPATLVNHLDSAGAREIPPPDRLGSVCGSHLLLGISERRLFVLDVELAHRHDSPVAEPGHHDSRPCVLLTIPPDGLPLPAGNAAGRRQPTTSPRPTTAPKRPSRSAPKGWRGIRRPSHLGKPTVTDSRRAVRDQ